MRKLAIVLFLAFSAAAYGASVLIHEEGLTSNGSTSWQALEPGLYVVSVYAPSAGTACAGGGAWDGANATVQFSPDKGTTAINVGVAALVGATANVNESLRVAKGNQFRITLASAGASTCLSYKISIGEAR